MTKGILAFGAYIPWRRLPRKAIADTHGWFNPALKGQAKGERAFCNWDEDCVTMAVEAPAMRWPGRDRCQHRRAALCLHHLPVPRPAALRHRRRGAQPR
jgi:hypothetical protein